MDDAPDPRPAPTPLQPTDVAAATPPPTPAPVRAVTATPRDAQRMAMLKALVDGSNARIQLERERGSRAAAEYVGLGRRYGMPDGARWECASEADGPVPEGVFYNPDTGRAYTTRDLPPLALVAPTDDPAAG